jgi:bacterioferritin-associated ferredoxin
MYVCLCNAINHVQIGQAIRSGACRPSEVYAVCGGRAQCGGCTRTVVSFIRNGVAGTSDVPGELER